MTSFIDCSEETGVIMESVRKHIPAGDGGIHSLLSCEGYTTHTLPLLWLLPAYLLQDSDPAVNMEPLAFLHAHALWAQASLQQALGQNKEKK